MHLKRVLKKAVKILFTLLILTVIIITCYYAYSFTGNENFLLKSNKEKSNEEIERLQVKLHLQMLQKLEKQLEDMR